MISKELLDLAFAYRKAALWEKIGDRDIASRLGGLGIKLSFRKPCDGLQISIIFCNFVGKIRKSSENGSE